MNPTKTKIVDARNVLSSEVETIHLLLRNTIKPEKKSYLVKGPESRNLNFLKKRVSKENKMYFDIILETLISKYLIALEELKLPSNFEINYEKYEEKFENYNEDVDYHAEHAALDLIYLNIGHNGRDFKGPIMIDLIKSYSMPSCLKKEDEDNFIWFILLYISNCYFDLCKNDRILF